MVLNLLIIFIISISIPYSEEFENATSCSSLLEQYGVTLSSFLKCSMNNAVPVSFCVGCAPLYQNLTEQYTKLINGQFVEANKTVKCHDKYIDQDRLNIVLSNQDYFVNLWTQAACTECFEGNSTQKSNETLEINHKIDNLKQCLTTYWDNRPCENCVSQYNEANSFYNEVLIKKHKENICFDVRDDMNRTRSLWSKSLKCCKREANYSEFAAFATCIAFLPVIFYISAYFCTKYYEKHYGVSVSDTYPGPSSSDNSNNKVHEHQHSNGLVEEVNQ